MKVLIAGSNGTVGSAVVRLLTEKGYEVARLVRGTPAAGDVRWDPDNGQIDAAGLEGFDGVVNLATMSWPLRWTDKAKAAMLANRLAVNGLLARKLAACVNKPAVLVCASGMGYYPDMGEEIITEEVPAGTNFLARFQVEGEAAARPAADAGIRVVHLRIPPVLTRETISRGGLRAGDGRQWGPWVARDELAGMVEFALRTPALRGGVNAVSPHPLRNAEFAALVNRALGRKGGLALPAFLLRALMGEMAEEFILASRRMLPARLQAAGYAFLYPELEQALEHELRAGVLQAVPAA